MQNKRGKTSFTSFSFLTKSERGQVTIFIILAVLIIGGVALFFTLKGSLQKESVISPEAAPIQNFVEDCLDSSLEDVVFDIGENGGYSDPSKVDSTPVLEVPYYLKNNQNLMPSLEQIESEISKEVSKKLALCTGDFVFFPEYKISKGKLSAQTTIEPESVLIDVKYPLYLRKSNFSSKISDFHSEIPVRLGIIYNAISDFIEEEKTSQEGICVDCLLAYLIPKNLKSNIFWEDNNSAIFIVRDFELSFENREFVYNFAQYI